MGEGLRVLIVDDEPVVSDTLAAMLIHLGASEARCIHDGEMAVELAAEESFDLIVCDLRMPGRDGVETMRLLAERGVQSSILLLSGSDQRLLKTAMVLGQNRGLNIVGALNKPVGLKSLGQFLQKAKEMRRPRRGRSVQLVGEEELAGAIENNELVLYYQPQVNLSDGGLEGVEALVRWRRSSGKLVFPDQFIPVAESTGLIEPMTDWVVAEAIRQSAVWHKQGLALGVSVNLSAKTLRRLDLPDRLAAAVEKAHLGASTLTLEVTESGLTEDVEALLDISARLRLKGFPLSIDDFGTGFSSLAQLKRLPFTELKLDRLFVSSALEDPDSLSLLESSVDLAKRLQLRTVAEGIETQAEWDLLTRLAVDVGQGYFMARPMPAEELPGWRQSWLTKVA